MDSGCANGMGSATAVQRLEKATAERQKGRDEYDRDYALLERLPCSGQFLMKVVRRLFGRGEMGAVARLLDEFMGKVLTVYGEGRLAREKLERFEQIAPDRITPSIIALKAAVTLSSFNICSGSSGTRKCTL